jgi:2-amino-4-hydroxy-6-hydroxymethyldihydropteridine diphosphokinase
VAAPESVVAYIGLGSNLADPASQIRAARIALSRLPETREIAFSALYRTPPMGPAGQPDYVNAVLAVETRLDAESLLAELQRIETEQGRVRTGERWGARTLDLDLLLYGQRQFTTPTLTVPHPGIAERAFVVYPLLEIAPDLDIPGLGPLRELALRVSSASLTRLAHD